jgi:hypothetical protein
VAIPVDKPEPLPAANGNGRPRSTINLQSAFKKDTEPEQPHTETEKIPADPDRAIDLEELKKTWDEFANQRKDQLAEYHLLKRDFVLEAEQVTISLSNSIEEPLLQKIRTPLTTFLRERLHNNKLSVSWILQQADPKKHVYTSKEKFDYLVGKNPILQELKDKLGLDTDF